MLYGDGEAYAHYLEKGKFKSGKPVSKCQYVQLRRMFANAEDSE